MKHRQANKPSGTVKSTMGGWNQRKIEKRGKRSVTPGKLKRDDTCQLTSIGGKPRKFFMRSRSYKDRSGYTAFCSFSDKVNGGSK